MTLVMTETDTTYDVVNRVKNGNNGYAITYDPNAAEGAIRFSKDRYIKRELKDRDGDTYFIIQPR
jgi:hypothetical protein